MDFISFYCVVLYAFKHIKHTLICSNVFVYPFMYPFLEYIQNTHKIQTKIDHVGVKKRIITYKHIIKHLCKKPFI